MINKDKHWYQKWWGVLILLLVAFVLAFFLAFAVYVWNFTKTLPSNTSLNYLAPPESADLQLIEGLGSNSFGTSKPQITIVEFGDFACPYCQKSFSTIRELSTKHYDKIRYIYRDYPVVTEYSLKLALASRCAGDQGLYWPMHDKLFINQGVTSDEELENIAKQIGADLSKFSPCLRTEKHLDIIRKDISDADQLGVSGTPTWFINGHELPGYIPHDIFVETIEKILQKTNNGQ